MTFFILTTFNCFVVIVVIRIIMITTKQGFYNVPQNHFY